MIVLVVTKATDCTLAVMATGSMDVLHLMRTRCFTPEAGTVWTVRLFRSDGTATGLSLNPRVKG